MPKDFAGVMHEWGQGTLHSGSTHGPKVESQKQAEAIAFSEQKQLGHGAAVKGAIQEHKAGMVGHPRHG